MMETGPGLSVGRPAEVAVARASLCVGAWETRYSRAGDGPPLLLLRAPGDEWSSRLLAGLATSHRVVAPDSPEPVRWEAAPEGTRPAGPAFDRWLADFLEGLGLTRLPFVVANPLLCSETLAFAAAQPCRVSCMVLLRDGGAASEELPLPVADRLPLLVRRASAGGGREALPSLVEEVRAFLASCDAEDGRR